MGKTKSTKNTKSTYSLDAMLSDLNAAFYAVSTLAGNDHYPDMGKQHDHTVRGLLKFLDNKTIKLLSDHSSRSTHPTPSSTEGKMMADFFDRCSQPSDLKNRKFRCQTTSPEMLMQHGMANYVYIGNKDQSEALYNNGLVIGLRIAITKVDNELLEIRLAKLADRTISYRMDYDDENNLHINVSLFGKNFHVLVDDYRQSKRFKMKIPDDKTCAQAVKYKFWFKMSFYMQPEEPVAKTMSVFLRKNHALEHCFDQAVTEYISRVPDSTWDEAYKLIRDHNSLEVMHSASGRKALITTSIKQVPNSGFSKKIMQIQDNIQSDSDSETDSDNSEIDADTVLKLS